MSALIPAHGPGCRPLPGTSSARFHGEPKYVCTANCPRRGALAREYDSAHSDGAQPLVAVAFKDEGERVGPVVLIRIEHPSREATDAAAAGVPFAYQQGDATDLGWLSHAEASAVAAEHGVALTCW
jgi:hypothetical protein